VLKVRAIVRHAGIPLLVVRGSARCSLPPASWQECGTVDGMSMVMARRRHKDNAQKTSLAPRVARADGSRPSLYETRDLDAAKLWINSAAARVMWPYFWANQYPSASDRPIPGGRERYLGPWLRWRFWQFQRPVGQDRLFLALQARPGGIA
jgi:hypothetical protein